jgi:hypothetical protein
VGDRLGHGVDVRRCRFPPKLLCRHCRNAARQG